MTDIFDFLDKPNVLSDVKDPGLSIRFVNYARADLHCRKIIALLETCETTEALDDYIQAEEPLINAVRAFSADLGARIDAAREDQHAILLGAQAAAERIAKAEASSAIHTSHTEFHAMANPDFKKFVFKDVVFSWPRLDQPYRYNPTTEKSEPCPANAQGAGYSLAWTMPYTQAKPIFEEMKAHYQDCQTRNSKLPAFATVFGLKKLKDAQGQDTGEAQFTAKKGAMSNDGKLNKEPTVVGADHKDLADKKIWGGSVGHVRVLAFPAVNPQDKSGGVSLLLDAVVVTRPEYGGDGLGDDFGDAAVVDDLPRGDTQHMASAGVAAPTDAPFDAPF